MASSLLIDVTDANFKQEVLDSTVPVLVDFWATWCGPCKALTPTLEEFAKTYEGKLKIVKFNVEDSTQVPQDYTVAALPTLLFFNKGAVATAIVGAPPKAKLNASIQDVLAKA